MDQKQAAAVLDKFHNKKGSLSTVNDAMELLNAHIVLGTSPSGSVLEETNAIITENAPAHGPDLVQNYRGSIRFVHFLNTATDEDVDYIASQAQG